VRTTATPWWSRFRRQNKSRAARAKTGTRPAVRNSVSKSVSPTFAYSRGARRYS
jgi:hypothetical protein